MARRTTANGLTCLLAGLIASVVALTGLDARAAQLDEMSLERWAKLREVERYQLNIAEKYYREKNYKVAASEYEKFLSLYETSEGAPYSLLKWSLCMVQQKKVNTAIKEGFQSVIDYWPESPEAVSSAYFIGNALKDMGETRKAKKAYNELVEDHPEGELVTVYALVDPPIWRRSTKTSTQVDALEEAHLRRRTQPRIAEPLRTSVAVAGNSLLREPKFTGRRAGTRDNVRCRSAA